MQNRAIEFHDCQIFGVMRVGSQVILCLRGYMHESSGRPGSDPGSEWIQAAALIFEEAEIAGPVAAQPLFFLGEADLPEMIYSGEICTDGDCLEMVPVPFETNNPVELRFHVTGWPDVVIRGSSARLIVIGEPHFVKLFNS